MQEAKNLSLPERLGRLALGAVLLLPPLVFLPSAKDAFRLPKLMFSEWLALASVLGLAWGLRRLDRVEWRALARIPVVRATVPLLAVAALSLVTSDHVHHVRAALVSLGIGLLALCVWSLALSGRELRNLLDFLLIPALLLGLLGVLQFNDIFRPLEFTTGEEARRFGITSLAGNAGDLGAFLVLPCLIAQAAWIGRRRRPWAWALAAVVLVYSIAVTQTLAALAALAVGSAVLWLGGLSRRRALAGLGLGLVAVALVAAVLVPRVPRFESKWRDVREGRVNALLTGRLDGWRTALWMAEQRPLVGVGHGAYRAEFAVAKLALLEEGARFYKKAEQPTFANAHNDPLELAAESGLLGLAALGWGVWLLVGALRRLPARGTSGEPEPSPVKAQGKDKSRGKGRRSGKGRDPDREPRAAATGGGDPERRLAVAGVAALGVLSLAHFPFRIALTAFPAVVLMAWIWSRSREIGAAGASVEAGR